MKAFYLLSIILSFLVFSCHSGSNTGAYKATFGIHEIVKVNDIPVDIMDSLKSMNVLIDNNQHEYIIGYVLMADSPTFLPDVPSQGFKIIKTFYPVDNDQQYCALVAVRTGSAIDNSHINKTYAKDKSVEIHLNFNGAKKWAKLTKENTGGSLAFVIDNQIYAMPFINGEIKNGIVLINGLDNAMIAKNISESLNASKEE